MSLLGQIANKEIFNFLRTATIKCSYFADQSRSLHIKSNITTEVPDNELPYYKHMAGEYILKNVYVAQVTNPKTGELEVQTYGNTSMIYDREKTHQNTSIDNRLIFNSSVFDEMMTVTSLDTQEEIPFTLQNLHAEYADDSTQVHEKTLAAYKLPSRYYDLLCERYPKQVDLIKAIVYPVQKAREITAIEQSDYDNLNIPIPSIHMRRRDAMVSAENFDILEYDDTLLDENERSSITTEMKAFTKMIYTRWNVKEYVYEENYATVLWTLLWSLLPVALIVQRYKNIRTPLAHSSHIWDYLISKGLESYKGYLTLDQTLFLYKNINYILQNRGKQKTTNLLIDELLNDVGLNIKAKTVVLDTTDNLDTTNYKESTDIAYQCTHCSRRTQCHKTNKTYKCPDFVGADDLCKSEPIVLTEEFAGATKRKIINVLKNQYGYSADEAEVKYRRSQLWRDADIEAIRLELDRDQLTDLRGEVEELDDLISREYDAGLEPIYNEDIVEEQRHDLRHIGGTYTPTKLLEVTKDTFTARFAQLFNKFLTETMLHLAPRDVNGEQVIKVKNNYTFNVTDLNSTYLMSFGELLAALYLGMTREWSIELFYDHVNDEETYVEGVDYFRWTAEGTDEEIKEETKTIVNANCLKKITVTSSMIGTPVGSNVYRWAPKVTDATESAIPAVDGHELLTKFFTYNEETGEWGPNFTYNFPIPDQIRLTTAFKFGKPVKQFDLVEAWLSDENDYSDYLSLLPGATKAVMIGDIIYGVKSVTKTDDDVDWDWCPWKLVITGEIKDLTDYYANNGEIPIIPRYFRWYSKHMNPDDEDKPGSMSTVPAKVFSHLSFDTDPVITDPVEITDIEEKRVYYDMRLNEYYQRIETEKYIGIDDLISQYVDLMEDVTKQSTIGNYLTVMFGLLQQLYSFVLCQNSILTNLAASTFLDSCLLKGAYKVNLTNTYRRTSWPTDSSHVYPLETSQIKVATYSDWLKVNKDIQLAFDIMDKKDDWQDAWNTFNNTCVNKLTEGCTLPYVSSDLDDTTIGKLKELVTHLSSYKIAFIDVANTEKSCDALSAIVSDSGEAVMEVYDHDYINPIYDSLCRPHAGGYLTEGGDFYIQTTDQTAQEGKTYYTVKTETKQSGIAPSEETTEFDLNIDTHVMEVADVDVGDELAIKINHYEGSGSTKVITETFTYYLGTYYEKINFYSLLGVTNPETQIKIIYNPDTFKWYYSLGTKVTLTKTIPTNALDPDANTGDDTYLPVSYITETLKTSSNSIVYRKQVSYTDYTWTTPVESEVLKEALDRTVLPNLLGCGEKVEISTITVTTDET